MSLGGHLPALSYTTYEHRGVRPLSAPLTHRPYCMKLFFDLESYSESFPRPVVTLGNFDGVHVGHQEIFRVLREEADALGGPTVVVTFHPHPLKILCPERAPRLITRLEEKIELVRACGNDVLLCLPFTRAFSTWGPDRFVGEILAGKLAASRVLIGEDFRFGRDRKGDMDTLRAAGTRYGFTVRSIPPVRITGREASSTRIRYCIQKGLIRESTALLGRLYTVSGVVEHGDRRGRELGFPTANVRTDAELLPPNGVYAVWVFLDDRVPLPGVASLGTKPTFAGKRFCVEVHLFDFAEDIYGTPLRVSFVEWLREERTFEGFHALAREIELDALKARRILAGSPPPARIRPPEPCTLHPHDPGV